METIKFSELITQKIDDLPYLLFDKAYFGFMESAEEYVNDIYDFINTIPTLPLRKTKKPKYGKYYARYVVKNNRTQYFITFDTKDGRYFIENIFTSHESGYATYIRGVK